MRVESNQLEAVEGMTPEYPYVMHHADLKETMVPWHWHGEVEFDYVSNGEIEVSTANKKYIFKKNEAFFINTNILCTMGAANGSQQAAMASHLLDPIFLGGHFKSVFQTKYMEPVLQNKKIDIVEIRGHNSRQKEILRKLQQVSFLQREENVEFQTRNLFSDIWMLLIDEIKEAGEKDLNVSLERQNRIQTMMSFIQNNYMEKISLLDIARDALVSKRECIRCFEAGINKTPFEYLLDYRIEIAEKLLKSTQNSIADIALQVGFSNSAYFAKIFKKKNGMTPRDFRKNYTFPKVL